MASPKKTLNELVAALHVEGVAFRVKVDELKGGKLQCFRLVASHAGLVDKAAALKTEVEAIPTPPPGAPTPAPHIPEVVRAAKYAKDLADKYEVTILRVFGDKVGPFDCTWPVRVEQQHLDPRSTHTTDKVCETEEHAEAHRVKDDTDASPEWKMSLQKQGREFKPRGIAFPALFAQIMADPETQSILSHIAELEA